jgi:hypothetical protein
MEYQVAFFNMWLHFDVDRPFLAIVQFQVACWGGIARRQEKQRCKSKH